MTPLVCIHNGRRVEASSESRQAANSTFDANLKLSIILRSKLFLKTSSFRTQVCERVTLTLDDSQPYEDYKPADVAAEGNVNFTLWTEDNSTSMVAETCRIAEIPYIKINSIRKNTFYISVSTKTI